MENERNITHEYTTSGSHKKSQQKQSISIKTKNKPSYCLTYGV